MKAAIDLGDIGKTNFKTIALYVVGGTTVILLILWGAKKIFRKEYSAGTMRGELGGLDLVNYRLTISKEDAILISQNLFNAMNRIGTDEKTIIHNLEKLQTKDDLILVIKTFGIKPYDGWGLADTWASRKFFSRDLNLSGWLQSELTGKDLDKVRQIYIDLGVAF